MHNMRALSHTHRLSALSIPEVREAIDLLTLVYARKRKFHGHTLKTGPLLNAIVLQFLDLPEAERQRFAFEGLSKLEALLADEAPPAQESAPPEERRIAMPPLESPKRVTKRRSG
jgi:hypothetical protein